VKAALSHAKYNCNSHLDKKGPWLKTGTLNQRLSKAEQKFIQRSLPLYSRNKGMFAWASQPDVEAEIKADVDEEEETQRVEAEKNGREPSKFIPWLSATKFIAKRWKTVPREERVEWHKKAKQLEAPEILLSE
jgi:hypothetical protein